MNKMQKKTAANVADILGLAEEWLGYGRPRKLPGKSRAEAMMYGLTAKVTRHNIWACDKVSLVGAFRGARLEQGYTRRTQKLAEAALAEATGLIYLYQDYGLQGIDDSESDTRQLIRDVRRTRKWIEKAYLAESA